MERSAIYDQVESAYYAMHNTSELSDDGSLRYWQGALTNLLEDNGISKSKYSSITSFLKDMGCIESIRRGAGSTPSVWQLHKPPNREDFDAVKLARNPGTQRHTTTKSQKSNSKALEQRVLDLADRVSVLESIVLPTTEEQEEKQ